MPDMSDRYLGADAMRGPHEQLFGLATYLRSTDLDPQLLSLVEMRASQINGCAYCLVMHADDLRKGGEREERLYVLNAWREAPWFSDRERAALAWTEAVTTLPNHQVPDDVFAEARLQFSERELADLTLAVIAINGWNRLNIAFQNPPPRLTFTPEATLEAAPAAATASV
ncbi:MAG TPA: carboxymuconolactone decarboxylase family protein [Thermomicrobiales bacterium]|nr:carboxymuconolactone decarboxylase family protein [Thermomicrobiales bacterium]